MLRPWDFFFARRALPKMFLLSRHSNTYHTTPSDTAHTQHTSFLVVFSRIHARLLIAFEDESFKFLTYQLAHTLCAIRSVRVGASHSILSKLRLQSSMLDFCRGHFSMFSQKCICFFIVQSGTLRTIFLVKLHCFRHALLVTTLGMEK